MTTYEMERTVFAVILCKELENKPADIKEKSVELNLIMY
jgi:hypothetical protein